MCKMTNLHDWAFYKDLTPIRIPFYLPSERAQCCFTDDRAEVDSESKLRLVHNLTKQPERECWQSDPARRWIHRCEANMLPNDSKNHMVHTHTGKDSGSEMCIPHAARIRWKRTICWNPRRQSFSFAIVSNQKTIKRNYATEESIFTFILIL